MKMVETNRPKPPLNVATETTVDTNLSRRRRQQQQRQQQQQQLQNHLQRHTKTVHFETDVRRDAGTAVAVTMQTTTDNGASVTSLPDQFDRHVQQLFTFIGSALSAGHDRYCSDDDDDDDNNDEDDDSVCDSDSDFSDGSYYGGGFCGGEFCDGGGDNDDRRSVSDNETARRKSSNRRRHDQHRRSAGPTFSCVARATSFERDVDKGNPPFRHMHCKTTAGTCNSVFLKKVT